MSKVCGNNALTQLIVEINEGFYLFFARYTQAVLTSIVLKQNVTMLDIVSTRMLGQFGFLAKVGYSRSHLSLFVLSVRMVLQTTNQLTLCLEFE